MPYHQNRKNLLLALYQSILGKFTLPLLYFVFVFSANASGNIEYGVIKKSGTNIRKGPGEKYPISWKTRKDNVPVEIHNSADGWYNTTDWNGEAGWVKQNLITTKRRFVVIKTDNAQLYRIPFNHSKETVPEVVGIFKSGFIAKLYGPCSVNWCRIQVDSVTTGWIERKNVWGA